MGEADQRTETIQPLVFRSLDRKNAYEEVRERLREVILTQDLGPARRLPTERELAEQFGVSRMVVREAIRGLEGSGLLSVRKGPHGGIFVAEEFGRPVTDSIKNLLIGGTADLNDLFEFRLLVEPYAAAQAAAMATAADLAQLSDNLRGSDQVKAESSQVRLNNIDFHRMVLRMAGNPIVAVLGDAVYTVLSNHIQGIISDQTTLAALDMHKKIYEAIRAGRAAEAEALVRQDIQETCQGLVRLDPVGPAPDPAAE